MTYAIIHRCIIMLQDIN